jgi:predicted membrane protein
MDPYKDSEMTFWYIVVLILTVLAGVWFIVSVITSCIYYIRRRQLEKSSIMEEGSDLSKHQYIEMRTSSRV